MVAGRKVVGSAQLRQGDALLQHGSILLADDQTTVGAVTRGAAPPDLAAPLCSMVAGDIDGEDLIGAVTDAAMARWPGDWRAWTEPELVRGRRRSGTGRGSAHRNGPGARS